LRKVYVIYPGFYDFYNKNITIGGIQTYINDLCDVLKIQYEVIVIQNGNQDISIDINGYKIIQFGISSKHYKNGIAIRLNELVQNDDLIIYATDTLISKKIRFTKSIAIQHGVYWDIPDDGKQALFRKLISKYLGTFRTISRLDYVNKVICVDNNFINWYRSQTNRLTDKLVSIPNYTRLSNSTIKNKDKIRIIFARRFYEYRGTKVFTNAILALLNKQYNIEVIIAGDGPDEQWMKEQLREFPQVSFIRYNSIDSLEIHRNVDIAVIPTVGSEGTSLSLLEAMASSCAIICTNVGGLTNIIIDEYNGIMIDAGNEVQLKIALEKLINSEKLRMFLSSNAFNTVKFGFPYQKWVNKWLEVISNM